MTHRMNTRRYLLILGSCVAAVACDGSVQPLPTAPSRFALTSSVEAGGPPVEFTFTKWITAFPHMTGFINGGATGTYAGEILSRTPFDNLVIVDLKARYEVIDPTGARSFKTVIEGKSTNGQAVLNGVITEGWMLGAQTNVTFDTITPCQFGTRNVCFTGVIRVMPASTPRSGTLRVTKECSEFDAGSFCTITSSNINLLEIGSRILYLQPDQVGTPAGSDVVLNLPGLGNNEAYGHCSTATNVCTFSGGTGKFTGFTARVDVSYLGGADFGWDGTYSFGPPK